MNKELTFKNLDDLTKTFNTELKCIKYFEKLRWNGERGCPHCGSVKTYVCKGHGKYKCGDCRKLFSITTGTYFENTKLPLRKWLIAMFLCLNHKKGVSSLQLAETLGITQKSAWFVLHRIRAIVSQQVPEMLLSSVVEADETFIGGKEGNRHAKKKRKIPLHHRLTKTEQKNQLKRSYAFSDRKMVLGAVERGGRVVTKFVDSLGYDNIVPFILKSIRPGSTLYTDERSVYKAEKIRKIYKHDCINHASKDYVRGNVHTNTIENYWSVVKRCINGTYHQLSAKHLQAYLDEFSFRYNNRDVNNKIRIGEAFNYCHGRLKYNVLIQKKTA